MKKWKLLLLGLLFLAGCGQAAETPALPDSTETVAYVWPTLTAPSSSTLPTSPPAAPIATDWPTNGWRTSTPEEQGMDSEILADMLARIEARNYDLDSVMVVRNGYVVTDAYIQPFSTGEKHIIFSCTKSVVSILIGIAIDQGYIESVDQPILDFFPDRTFANMDAAKEAMTLEDVLTMSNGLDCRDSYLYDWEQLRALFDSSEDWVQDILDLPMAHHPGTYFEYCNSGSFLLSAILQELTGVNALAFGRENLFSPLGITDIAWEANDQGISLGYSDIYLTPHDMAKIGYLYLNEGIWDGEQIVSSAWVEASTQSYIPATLQDGYGYQWWIDADGFYMALGYAGQFIFVYPEYDLVVVFTSDPDGAAFTTPEKMLREFILPAIVSTEPLPENPDGVALLEANTDALANP